MTRLFKFILIACLFSCETVVDIDIPLEKRKLVVQAFFTEGNTWKVYVTHSMHILDNANFSPVTDATVKIFEEGQEVEQLKLDQDGSYTSEFHIPIPNKNYRIEVSAPKYETVSATAALPEKIELISTTVDTTIITEKDYFRSYKAKITFNDPPEKNYYELFLVAELIDIYKEQVPSDSGLVEIIRIDTFYNEMYFEPVDPAIEDDQFGDRILLEDTKFNGSTYDLEIFIEEYYIDRCCKQVSDWNNRQGYSHKANINVYLRTISEEKYLFERTSDIQDYNDGDPFAEPIPVYNNIENGYGIFAGFRQHTSLLKSK